MQNVSIKTKKRIRWVLFGAIILFSGLSMHIAYIRVYSRRRFARKSL